MHLRSRSSFDLLCHYIFNTEKTILFITGAGLSVSSGIPLYRSDTSEEEERKKQSTDDEHFKPKVNEKKERKTRSISSPPTPTIQRSTSNQVGGSEKKDEGLQDFVDEENSDIGEKTPTAVSVIRERECRGKSNPFHGKAIWNRFVEHHARKSTFLKCPKKWYEVFWRESHDTYEFRNAKPTPGHKAISRLCKIYPNRVNVITQNIDGLHEKSGCNAIEVHGRLGRYRCVHRFCPNAQIRVIEESECVPDSNNFFPLCDKCYSVLMPLALMFDESYESHDGFRWKEAKHLMKEADVIVFAGTSFSVTCVFRALEFARKKEVPIFNINVRRFDYILYDRLDEEGFTNYIQTLMDAQQEEREKMEREKMEREKMEREKMEREKMEREKKDLIIKIEHERSSSDVLPNLDQTLNEGHSDRINETEYLTDCVGISLGTGSSTGHIHCPDYNDHSPQSIPEFDKNDSKHSIRRHHHHRHHHHHHSKESTSLKEYVNETEGQSKSEGQRRRSRDEFEGKYECTETPKKKIKTKDHRMKEEERCPKERCPKEEEEHYILHEKMHVSEKKRKSSGENDQARVSKKQRPIGSEDSIGSEDISKEVKTTPLEFIPLDSSTNEAKLMKLPSLNKQHQRAYNEDNQIMLSKRAVQNNGIEINQKSDASITHSILCTTTDDKASKETVNPTLITDINPIVVPISSDAQHSSPCSNVFRLHINQSAHTNRHSSVYSDPVDQKTLKISEEDHTRILSQFIHHEVYPRRLTKHLVGTCDTILSKLLEGSTMNLSNVEIRQ